MVLWVLTMPGFTYPPTEQHREKFRSPRNSLVQPLGSQTRPLPQARATIDLFYVLVALPFPECHRNGITEHGARTSGFFHGLAKCMCGSATLPHELSAHGFWLPGSAPLRGYKTACLPTHLRRDILAVARFGRF